MIEAYVSAWDIRISRQSTNEITPEHELSYILKTRITIMTGVLSAWFTTQTSFVSLSMVPWYVVTFLGM
jgi:hypothetical protein